MAIQYFEFAFSESELISLRGTEDWCQERLESVGHLGSALLLNTSNPKIQDLYHQLSLLNSLNILSAIKTKPWNPMKILHSSTYIYIYTYYISIICILYNYIYIYIFIVYIYIIYLCYIFIFILYIQCIYIYIIYIMAVYPIFRHIHLDQIRPSWSSPMVGVHQPIWTLTERSHVATEAWNHGLF